jgi:hypothetical protein
VSDILEMLESVVLIAVILVAVVLVAVVLVAVVLVAVVVLRIGVLGVSGRMLKVEVGVGVGGEWNKWEWLYCCINLEMT